MAQIFKKKAMSNIGEHVEQLELSYIVSCHVNGIFILENTLAVSYEIKYKAVL